MAENVLDAIETPEERKARLRLRIMEASLKGRNERQMGENTPSTFLAPESELEIRADLAADTPFPDLVGAGKFFVDAFRNVKRAKAFISGDDDELIKIDRQQQQANRLFEILRQRRPEATVGNLFASFATAFVVPGERIKKGSSILTGARQQTLRSEAAAGAVVGSTASAGSIEELGFNTVGGLFIGPAVLKLLQGVNSAGRVFIGGKPAAIQDSADLLEAEKTLRVTGLLTTGELRAGGRVPPQAGRLLLRLEGVLDNIPVVLFGLSGRRESQLQMFDNALNTVRAAFPDIGEEQARRIITKSLTKMEDKVKSAYSKIRSAVPDNAAQVVPTHYRATAQRLLDKELAKGARADAKTIAFLEKQAETDAVDFLAATEISGDLARRARIASRAAQDPANTGVDAGVVKLLGKAHFRDMEAWARQFPENSEVFRLWSDAKQIYKDTILPFNKRPLAPIFDENGFDHYSLSKALMDPNKGRELSKLDEEGALGFLFVNNLLEEATDAQGNVNIRKLVNTLNNSRKNRALVQAWQSVPDESKLMLNSLAKLVDASPRVFSRGTQNVLQTTAGTALLGAGIGAASSDNKVEGATTGLTTAFAALGFVRFMVGSQAGRAMLTSAARVPKGNREKLAEIGRRAQQSYSRFIQAAAFEPAVQDTAIDQAQSTRQIILDGMQ